jgi:CPA1 family monovalent cation:H+ antiporter
MGEITLINSTLAILCLLVAATTITFAFRKSKIPHAVVLMIAGVFLAFTAQNFATFSFLTNFKLSPQLIFYIFLPTLIFESAFHINFKQFKRNSKTILWLSTVGVIAGMFLIGAAMHYLLGLPWSISLLFGALISPTDPVSVLSMFKRTGAPPRLATIVEGESLINDGMALVLFEIMLEIVKHDNFEDLSITQLISEFGLNVVGGILIGCLFGFFFAKALAYVKNSKEIEISITLILAHLTFIVADYFFGVSGILATVTAGIILGNYGAFKISPAVKEIMIHFWDYVTFFANSILFLIIGLTLWDFRLSIINLLKPTAIVVSIVLLARALVVYTIIPISNFFHKKEKIPKKWAHIIQWSGLRGALIMALALTIPPETPFYKSILIFSSAVVFVSIALNGLTIEPLMSFLGLKKFSKVEAFEYEENKLLIDKRIECKLKVMLKNHFISKNTYKQVSEFFKQDGVVCKKHLQHMLKKSKGELSKNQVSAILKRHLLGIERGVFTKLYYHGEITENLLNILIANLDLQLENSSIEKTPIGKLTTIKTDGAFAKLLKIIGLEKIVKAEEEKEIMLRYEMYRSRKIATEEVLAVLKEFEENHLLFDKNILNFFKKRYNLWLVKAKEKIKVLEAKHPKECKKIQIYLAKQAAYKVEAKVINDFKKTGIINEKLHQKFISNLEERYSRELN